MRGGHGRRGAAAVFLTLILVTMARGGGVAVGQAAGGVTVSASIDGHSLGHSSQNKPVKLFPRQESELDLSVTNGGANAVDVTKVRLQGQVIGLTFFEYDTSVSMTVGPSATETRRLVLDLGGLDGQATGLIPGTVKVLDSRRHVLAQQNGVVDVRGSLRSVYGLFGLGVAFLTALSFLGALVGLARHRLPVNRWHRGLRFLTPGLGLGLVVNFTLSATRVFVPQLGRWLTITMLCAVVLFALGYLTPTPDLEEEELEPEEEVPTHVIEEITVLAIAARPARAVLAAQPSPSGLPPAATSPVAVAAPPWPSGLPPAATPPPEEPSPAGPVNRDEPLTPGVTPVAGESVTSMAVGAEPLPEPLPEPVSEGTIEADAMASEHAEAPPPTSDVQPIDPRATLPAGFAPSPEWTPKPTPPEVATDPPAVPNQPEKS